MGLSVRACSSSSASLSALTELCAWATDLRLAYAWATSKAGSAAHWKALRLEKVTQATIGIEFAQTEPAALRALLACGDGVLKVIEDTGGVFHPKVIIGLRGREARALVGSSNFTHKGFAGNTEMNLLLEGHADEAPLADLLAFVEQQWTHSRAFVPDAAWLERYDRAYAGRPRPKPVPKSVASRTKVLVRNETDLDTNWADYFALIGQQERRTLSNGYEIHVFEHPDGSYLQEIEQCQASFRAHPTFHEMPLEERKFVAGFGGTSGYFGRMGGAGNYKNLIIQRPEEIGPYLDAVPAAGKPTDRQVIDYFDGVTAIHGVSLATATRLLIAKRCVSNELSPESSSCVAYRG